MKLYAAVEALLKNEPNYVTDDGDLKKWVIISKAQNCDTELISLLLENPEIKTHFFIPIKDILVFNQALFIQFMEQKNYLNDSFTAYKNKIGLTIDGKFLNQRNEVALVWPYKDCILEGGQSREEDKREEIFFNEVLAQDEINQLLDPKVLTNVKTYTSNGEKVFEGFTRNEQGTITDNLVIKGNNLLALHSLKEEFAGKVKLIYIDPPYNTGKDGFGYNDNFNHSTWLTFMKNRLEVARNFLCDNGSIWISLDDKEMHYCKAICDEIFGKENFISTIIWNSKYTVSNDAKYISYQHENILFYAKNKSNFTIGLLERTEEQNGSYKNPDNDKKGVWKATPLHAKSGKEENNYTINFSNGITWSPPKGRYPRYSKQRLIDIFDEGGLYFNKNGGVDKKTYLSEVKQGVTSGSVWNYSEVGHSHSNNEELASILGKGIFENPKGTSLIKKILKIGNVRENEIVLDYHAGSATTAHAVLELNKEDGGNRQFILCEQMNYIETVTANRIQKVIERNNSGSFTYFELKKYNQTFIDKILEAKDSETLFGIWEEMKNKSFLNYNIAIQKQEEHIEDFKKLEFSAQQELLITLLDKNQLYVNLSSLEDKDFECTAEELKVTQDFYQLNK
ncbi:site-specific DNA-methyltransferase [Flavobacterium sp. XS2P24]|uniref:DNA methyltransferase n=1 Tax=Flavobacterium sp. XS2P24 TaxID=3041249 RepID=UPI0024A84BD2|nr:site-specific DNA-methyltransferase [Flavobacterium sp. XS2P24]MDI6048750.1 site-specific DNA-methyltransferase [Flavobacterium sp. XS2P24]